MLGAISAYFGALYQGIVAQAVLATLGVFLVMLVLYGLRILRATPRFVKGVIGATFGIMFMYLGVFVAEPVRRRPRLLDQRVTARHRHQRRGRHRGRRST